MRAGDDELMIEVEFKFKVGDTVINRKANELYQSRVVSKPPQFYYVVSRGAIITDYDGVTAIQKRIVYHCKGIREVDEKTLTQVQQVDFNEHELERVHL